MAKTGGSAGRPARIGPPKFPKSWSAPYVTDYRNWRQTGWLYSPEGELLLNYAVTGNQSADHGDASEYVLNRLGKSPKREFDRRWDYAEGTLDEGWMQPRFWGDVSTPYLSIRIPGASARDLRRAKTLVDKLSGLGVPVMTNRISVMYGIKAKNGGTWTGSYADFMTAESWLDLGG